jgi:hypothetical protein
MNFATASTEQLQAAGYTVKRLRQRRPRKGELIMSRVGGSAAVSAPSNENRPDTQPNWFYMGR